MTKPVTVGIIAEYHPFHLGHAYQLRCIRARFPAARIVVAMSGSIVQRGSFAVLDKWQRAAAAVKNGTDLVLELPFAFACRSAEPFAAGGVRLLAALGCTHLAFGAEAQDLSLLTQAVEAMETAGFQAALHTRLAGGVSYAAATGDLLAERTGLPDGLLRAPNNILAIAYLRAIRQYAPGMQGLLIHREGAAYHEETLTQALPSATAIRKALQKPDWQAIATAVPQDVLQDLCAAMPEHLPCPDLLLRTLQSKLLTTDDAALRTIVGMGEGLEHRLRETARAADAWNTLLEKAATRRYQKSRLSRLLLHLLLEFPAELAASFDCTGPRYLRVLALNARGKILLHDAKKRTRLPLIAKTGAYLKSRDLTRPMESLAPLQQMLLYDIRATELRNLALPMPEASGKDFLQSPIVCT